MAEKAPHFDWSVLRDSPTILNHPSDSVMYDVIQVFIASSDVEDKANVEKAERSSGDVSEEIAGLCLPESSGPSSQSCDGATPAGGAEKEILLEQLAAAEAKNSELQCQLVEMTKKKEEAERELAKNSELQYQLVEMTKKKEEAERELAKNSELQYQLVEMTKKKEEAERELANVRINELKRRIRRCSTVMDAENESIKCKIVELQRDLEHQENLIQLLAVCRAKNAEKDAKIEALEELLSKISVN